MARKGHGKGAVSKLDVLIDSDAFVGYFYPNDSLHDKASYIFANLEQERKAVIATSMVIAETATVLSYRSGQALATKFLAVIEKSKLPIIHIDEKLQNKALELFKTQQTKGTSVIDCANVAVMHYLKIPTIFSFDKFYEKHSGIQTIASVGFV